MTTIPMPKLLIIDHDQRGELIVPTHQVQPEPSAFYPQRTWHPGQPAHRLGKPARMHGSGSNTWRDCRVNVTSAEQFLFHLPPQRGTDLSISTVVSKRLVEALRNHRQLACGIENVAG